jgi:hypothetical protein
VLIFHEGTRKFTEGHMRTKNLEGFKMRKISKGLAQNLCKDCREKAKNSLSLEHKLC